MKLGFAQIDITPDRPIPLSGFGGPQRLGRKGERPLLAQAAWFEDNDGQSVLLFAADLIGFDQAWTDQLRTRLHTKTGIPPTHLILNASHTHCGPQMLPNLKDIVGVLDERFVRETQDRLFELGCAALQDLAPAVMNVSAGTNTHVTHRRRWEGTLWKNAPNYTDEPVRDLPILDCRWQDGRRLLIFSASGHPTTAAETIYDPHYIGRARERLREELGDETNVMFLQGVTGDTKMTTPNPLTGGWIQDMKEDIRIASAKITADILRTLPFSKPLEPSFRIVTKSIQLPLWRGLGRDVSTRDALAMLADAKTVASWDELRTGGFIPYEMQILSFANDYRWIVLGGEPCTDVGRRVKRVFEDDETFVVGYCNHLPSYIPSRRVAVEGGYEGRTSFQFFSHENMLHPDTEDLIARGVGELKSMLNAAGARKEPVGSRT